MFIKQVIIEGFKSYREQVATEPFSPKHNVVVGANGSGKTNFFHAIRFVLSDLFHNLRAEDRQALLHEGAGHQVMSAFVEIVFDNSDNRIPVDHEEVRLRRTIGLKKDEYFLDRKHITKTEVMNLLESAGFSRSNPYYVVQQGKIASLTLMKDSERLDLLKEIGGTSVYEERRKESLKIMQETESKRKQIIEVVQFIEERLKELDEEKEELGMYQQLDKQLRSLEYTIFDKELADVKQKLEQVDEARAKVSEASSTVHNEMRNSQEKLAEVENELKYVVASLQEVEKEQQRAEKGRTEAIKVLKNVELDVSDLEGQISGDRVAQKDIEAELGNLQNKIQFSQRDLEVITPMFEAELAKERDVSRRINDCDKEIGLLYQKQGRSNQFSSVAERDAHLEKEISNLEAIIKKSQLQIIGLEKDTSKLSGSLTTLSSKSADMVRQMQELDAEIKSCLAQKASMKADRDELHGKQKVLRKEEAELEEQVRKARDEIQQAERALESSMPRDARQGVEAVRRLTKDHNISGVHGCLIELISCEDKFNTAVEVTAGNSLFNIVVENDSVSTRLTKYLLQQRAGRVTFYPLNRIRFSASNLDMPSDRDTVPLLKKLQFDQKFGDVVGQVFGRAVICRNLDVATRVARAGNLDCITMEGDQVERKGAMRGGHYDNRRSRIRWVKIRQENQQNVEEIGRRLEAVRSESATLDVRISGIVGEIEKLEAKQRHAKMLSDSIRADMKHIEMEESTIKRTIETKERSMSSIRESVADNMAAIASRRSELGTPLSGRLSADEAARLDELLPLLDALKESLTVHLTQRMEIEARKAAIEEALSENLLKRRSELEGQLAVMDVDVKEAELQSKRDDLKAAKLEVQDAEKNRKEILVKIEREQKRVRELKTARDELKQKQDQFASSVQDEAKDLEQLLNRRIVLQQQQDDLMRKIRDLGSLPADAFDKYQKKSLKELHKMLHKCSQQLKKYSHVNKKALDQYVNFTEQREELHRRQAELDTGDQKIKELISVLDNRKDEAIERTFKGVAKNFRDAFLELVPHGHGSLVMMKKRRTDDVAEDEDGDDEDVVNDRQSGRIEKYNGVKVKVSFTGQGETQSMKQLSGGQKTVVALALIFAIQRCDPAPFYLFDEIDAALDPQYRTAVSNMIRKQADTSQTQFITTTFRPELVKVCDQAYGVFHRNRISRVDIIAREDALRFIEQDQSRQ